jgi:HEAT repeat protein
MSFQSRTPWLRATVVACAAVTLVASAKPAHAQTSTRQVPVESLLYDLKNPDPVRRQTAARQLGMAKHLAAISDLLAMTHDPDPSVRREVELSLEQMEDIRTLPGFVDLSSDGEKDIRDRAIDAMVSMHLPRPTGFGGAVSVALTRFRNLLDRRPEEYLDLIIEPDVPVDPTVIAALRARLSDSVTGIRRSASRGLGILRAEAAVPDLLQTAREDRDDEVRFEAVQAIRKIGIVSAGEQLLPLLNLSNDKVRNEIVATLGSLRYRRAVADLTHELELSKPSERSHVLALSALADIADPSSAPLFERLKADKDETIRLYANEGLARLADASQQTAISASRLTEKSSRVQTAQAFALLQMGQVEYLDELIRGLGNFVVRDLAKEYLAETPLAQRPALLAARPEKAGIRAELADVFGAMGDRSALPALLELTNDSDSTVARNAERAARRINAANRGE